MSYNIAGMVVKNEYLALGTMVATGAIAYGKLSGGEKPTGPVRPAPIEKDQTITATSKAEEDFIRQFVAEAEKEGPVKAH
ncbi:uncharacterized protein MKK02DRAFT_39229 [Dioszegia hungarica]|uniref:Uncharacterized protein n=1 Tax=Dioszegia hungarica TaxID=4972 RepID=A0AA38H367_9TREE|nr:uncharacterized protein MKK02DRAFT_39229 [Dioszegia hungarica]KAI9633250.1 hypothetical protein MKK02DRAFT_39229 [Dioszegia hungarica]